MVYAKNRVDEYVRAMRKTTASGNSFTLSVTGYSMIPFLRPGLDSVIISPASGIRRGDILLVTDKTGSPVLHRVFRLKRGHFVLLGDSRLIPDGPYPPESVIGSVSSFIRDGKTHRFSEISRLAGICWMSLRILRPFFIKLRKLLKPQT